MHGTHFKHCLLIPPLVSNNNLALIRCGYMCAGMLVHISRHLGKMSNKMPTMDSLYALPCLLPLGFTSDFRIYDHCYIIAAYILLYHLGSIPPVSCPYLIIPWVFLAWYHLLFLYCSCMPVPTTRFLMHVYDSDLSIHVCLSMHAIWHSHHHSLGSSDSFGFLCSGLRA